MMDLNGLLYQPDYQEDRGSKNILTVNSMTSLLQNLGILNLNSETAKDRLTKARLTGGLVEDYMKLLNQAEILAAESENTFHLSALNFVERMILFLIPDIDSNSFLPFGVCIAQFSSDYFFSQLFKNQEGFPHKVFSFSESGYNFEVTVGRRNHFAITEESIFGKNNCSKKLTKLLHSAFHLKSKDLVVKRFEKETFIGCWKYLHNKRLVLAGSCSFSNEDLKQLNLAFLPWLILTYSILVLLLLSKTLTRIFISPLDALVEGALRVDVQEDYETRIASSSNDEFDDLISSFNNMNKGLQEKKHMARFLSNQLLTNINEELETTDAKSIKKIEAAIIFSDIRNFTTISETNPPEEVVELLNEYFSCMEKAILENGGTIEKFIGDAILATFTYSFPEKKEEKACLAAMEMKKQLQKFNQNRKQNELFEIENGVGISTGEIYSGSLGVAGNMEFVLSGDKTSQHRCFKRSKTEGRGNIHFWRS
jgi:adenylate cyclase